MKTKKRTTITVETFESMVIQLKQMPNQIFCSKCQSQVSEIAITKIVSAQPVSDNEAVYLFVTESGRSFFLEII